MAMASRGIGFATAAAIMIGTLAMKSLVQIREGLAFCLLVSPLIAVFARNGRRSLVAAVAAALVHAGLASFVAVRAIAAVWSATGPLPCRRAGPPA
jgi:hypothetical protein